VTNKEVSQTMKLKKKLQFLRDKQYTESLMQQFLLSNSDIIIIVVNQLTFADQKMINRITAEFKGKKKIFILHNFSSLYTTEDVERYIKMDILETFKVEECIFSKYYGAGKKSQILH